MNNLKFDKIEDINLSCSYDYVGDELSPIGMKKTLPDPFNL